MCHKCVASPERPIRNAFKGRRVANIVLVVPNVFLVIPSRALVITRLPLNSVFPAVNIIFFRQAIGHYLSGLMSKKQDMVNGRGIPQPRGNTGVSKYWEKISVPIRENNK